MRSNYAMLALLAVAAVSGLSQAAVQDHSTAPVKNDAAAQRVSQQAEDGKFVFQQQCSRCHNAPEGFSPRVSATIIRHMRVRASLSKGQEEDLLRFLNP